MDDRTRTGTSFIDEDLDFDSLLEDSEPHGGEEAGGRAAGARAKGPYKPPRLRNTPNWSRIATAGAVAAVFLFVVGFGIKSYLDHRATEQYRTYFAQVSEVTDQSSAQGKELQNLLAQPSGSDRAQLIARVEKLSARAGKLVIEAKGIDAPDPVAGESQWLVTTLEYRRNGLASLQRALTGALGSRNASGSAAAVAQANARLLASDVIYSDSYVANARKVLATEGVTGVTVPESRFVTDPEFTSLKGVQLMLERLTSGGLGVATKKGKKVNDGKVHGGQLGAVTVSPSGQTLTAGTTTEVAGSDDLSFEVTFQNQGEVQETLVPVVIRISGENSEPQELKGTIDSVDPGGVGSVSVPMKQLPDFGQTVKVTVTVGPVPGEKTTDNNSAAFDVLFKL